MGVCPAGSLGMLEAVLALIRQSKKPIIYAGGGIVQSGAAGSLKVFAEKTGIPVALTVHGLGGFPSEHFLCLQMLGMHGTVYSNYAINEADLLIALGVRFDDRVTGKVSEFAKHGKIVHIDIDPSEINKNKAAHLPIVGDIGQALGELLKLLDSSEGNREQGTGNRYADWLRQIDEWRDAEPRTLAAGRNLGRRRADRDAARAGVAGVGDEIHQYLLDLPEIARHRGGRPEIEVDLHVRAGDVEQHRLDVTDQLVEAERLRLELAAPAEREQLTRQLGGPRDRVDDQGVSLPASVRPSHPTVNRRWLGLRLVHVDCTIRLCVAVHDHDLLRAAS